MSHFEKFSVPVALGVGAGVVFGMGVGVVAWIMDLFRACQ